MENIIVAIFMHVLFVLGLSYLFFCMGAAFSVRYGIDGAGLDVKEEKELPYVEVEIKKIGNVFYIYRNNDFLFQAKTKEEVETELIKRYPNKQILSDTASREVLYGKSV